MENPIKMDDLRVPLFSQTSIWSLALRETCWQQLVGGFWAPQGPFALGDCRIRTPKKLLEPMSQTYILIISIFPNIPKRKDHMSTRWGRRSKVSWNPWSPPFRRPYGACLEDASPRCRARRRESLETPQLVPQKSLGVQAMTAIPPQTSLTNMCTYFHPWPKHRPGGNETQKLRKS